ncbi:MAG: hypothetical protein JO197_04820 [Acidobacteria bacterium]|nr:hypothetical protein [Acidobacteriota bacterium]MBV9475222.1 hypothetical protein [Acidobacteriota bacterium]
MGNEVLCRVEVDDTFADAKALLETDELIFRGGLKLRVPFREMQNVSARDGVLQLQWHARSIRVHAGAEAEKWAEKIRNPKSVADKLGIKRGQLISISGTLDAAFLDDLRARGADVSSRIRANSDVIFVAANTRKDLGKLAKLRPSLAPAGALWVIRPKGIDAITESDVMAAGQAVGLVDVKVVRFSDTLTAEKFVIRLKDRA